MPIEIEHLPLTTEQKLRFAAIREAFPAKTFVPNQSQFDFIRAIGLLASNGVEEFLITSANGVGKSAVVINILLNIIYKNVNIYRYVKDIESGKEYDGFFNYGIYKKWPKKWPKKIWFISKKDNIDQLWSEFEFWFPKGHYDTELVPDKSKDGKTYVRHVKWADMGWEMVFKTWDQDEAVFEGGNVGIVLFDEPPPQHIYASAQWRIRKGGIIILAGTPLTGAGYLQDEFIMNDRLWSKVGGHRKKTKFWMRTDMYSNCIETAGYWDLGIYGLHRKGVLSLDYVENRRDTNKEDPDVIEARVFGLMKHLTGVIYKQFKSDIHVVDHDFIDQTNGNNYRMIIDPHDRRPPFVIWVELDRFNRQKIIREYPSWDDPWYHGRAYHTIDTDKYTIAVHIQRMIEIERDELKIHPDNIDRIMDPNFGKKPIRSTNRTVSEEYAHISREKKYPMQFDVSVDNDIKSGHAQVKELLRIDNYGDPIFTVYRKCRNVIMAFQRYAYREYSGKDSKENRGYAEEVKELHKDPMDVVRYHAKKGEWKHRFVFALPENKDYDFKRERPTQKTQTSNKIY
jgi:phage terminase large subunit-like protein